jgi:Na+:H+ antiporter, NhaA family
LQYLPQFIEIFKILQASLQEPTPTNNRMKLTQLFNDFFDSEKAGGLVLVFVTALSLFLANSAWQTDYINFWHFDLGGHSIIHWINDGLMTIFFLLIGLELEREIYHGELSDIKNASLPIFGAIGGMLVPAGLFLVFNYGTNTQAGAGIPMATDIAFAIGILSLLGNRIPTSLKIFLTALAVMDDLGAIIIIAIFYTASIAFMNLFIALCIFGVLLILNRLKVYNLIPYLIGGVVMWYYMLHSGVHATITGVLLAFAIPFSNGGEKSPSYILQHFLHKPVAFFILPLFAIANTCISVGDNWQSGLGQTNSLGIIAGLVIGKPLGIWLFSFIGVGLKLCTLPTDLQWKNIIGAGFLGGIGFTMSIFTTLLAFDNEQIVNNSKIAILIASFLAGTIGFIFLKLTLKIQVENNNSASQKKD